MNNDEVSVPDILAKEGLGSFAFKLETLHPDLESARLTGLLATVIQETDRLPKWWDQSSEQASAARECHRQTMEAIEGLNSSEEHNYRRLLVIGYLYGRLTKPSREVKHELFRTRKEVEKLEEREERRLSGPRSVEAQREVGRQWMRNKAAEIWENDHSQELRIGKVTEMVKKLVEKEVAERKAMGDESAINWPRSIDIISKTIHPEAPPYAKKRGRERKK